MTGCALLEIALFLKVHIGLDLNQLKLITIGAI